MYPHTKTSRPPSGAYDLSSEVRLRPETDVVRLHRTNALRNKFTVGRYSRRGRLSSIQVYCMLVVCHTIFRLLRVKEINRSTRLPRRKAEGGDSGVVR